MYKAGGCGGGNGFAGSKHGTCVGQRSSREEGADEGRNEGGGRGKEWAREDGGGSRKAV
eukprot:CAMPEP_0181216670 /NCGR_PEP_ID=MMETSP1096-20121128/26717_1 /TAXON_ID=156174 ORGANISM="Chrysochromulina ericina, Strain CCMP281" /NCGR_SAMPLE_ID=MMETSP1096 /ASSEMBLY_ACC=CAM_ASM_000453 /LENGTH=58 /DNA_ID=CAMNT_0023308701 /DNA_START=371 /DNA_END=547 /DNA_ORIENTATION=-